MKEEYLKKIEQYILKIGRDILSEEADCIESAEILIIHLTDLGLQLKTFSDEEIIKENIYFKLDKTFEAID